MRKAALAMAVMAAAMSAASGAVVQSRSQHLVPNHDDRGPRPFRPGNVVGRGTKTRGNKQVQRAQRKKRNVARHRKACRA